MIPLATDWPTIASLATAAGTLVLAIATFSSVRSSQASARIAERTLQLTMRPILVTSRVDDPPVPIMFGDGRMVKVAGATGAVEVEADNYYFAIPLRNAGQGVAVINSWRLTVPPADLDRLQEIARSRTPPPLEEFRDQSRDLYVPPGDIGFWQGAVRDSDDPFRPGLAEAVAEPRILWIDMLYGDHEGGQQRISRFTLTPRKEEHWLCQVVRHWTLDDP